MEYISVEEAKVLPGMRLVLTAGVPGPWGEAAKALLNYKGISWTPVFQKGGATNKALREWTGQTSAPVAVYEDLPPACHWLDLLSLIERLESKNPLLPRNPLSRAKVIGLSALIAGSEGFGWQVRLQMIAPMMQLQPVPDTAADLAKKYGFSPAALKQSIPRLEQISAALDEQLAGQLELGSAYFVGDEPTAVDFYWASFVGMVRPLPEAVSPLPDWVRKLYYADNPAVQACITPGLEAHRDMMYARHINLPLDF